MGGAQSSTAQATTKISNNMLSNLSQSCTVATNSSISGISIIAENSTVGDINISSATAIDGVSCIMKTYQDSQLTTTLEDMIKQTNSATNGFSWNFNAINEFVKINQYLENNITHIQNTSCNILADSEVNDVYIIYKNVKSGDINITSSSKISNSSCNMDNVSKQSAYNEITNEVTQKASIKTIGAMIIAFILLCVVVFVIIIIISTVGKSASSGGNKGMSTDDLVKLIGANAKAAIPPGVSESIKKN